MPHLAHGGRLWFGFGQRRSDRGDVVVAQANLADRVCKGQEVITGGIDALGWTIQWQSDDFPTARDAGACRVLGAQVEGPGDANARQRAEDGSGIGIHVGQRCHSREDAGRP